MAELYILFTATDLKVGRLIRTVSKSKYNHISLSLNPQLTPLYSYSRYRKSPALHGGFTEESLLRYLDDTPVKIAKLQLTEMKGDELDKYLMKLEKGDENMPAYYNLLSIALYPLGVRAEIKGCYTCAEFALSILRRYAEIVDGDTELADNDRETLDALKDAAVKPSKYDEASQDAVDGEAALAKSRLIEDIRAICRKYLDSLHEEKRFLAIKEATVAFINQFGKDIFADLKAEGKLPASREESTRMHKLDAGQQSRLFQRLQMIVQDKKAVGIDLMLELLEPYTIYEGLIGDYPGLADSKAYFWGNDSYTEKLDAKSKIALVCGSLLYQLKEYLGGNDTGNSD